jgi:hypothetical protein
MRLSSCVASRTLFLVVSLLCCARVAAPRPLNSPPRRIARRKQNDDLVAGQSQAASQAQMTAVSAGDFSITANPVSLVIVNQSSGKFGGLANGMVSLAGLNGFSGNVNLSCTVSGGNSQDLPTCFLPDVSPADLLFVDASAPASTTGVEAFSDAPDCEAPVFNAVPNIFGDDSVKFAEASAVIVLLAFMSCLAGFSSKRSRAKIFRLTLVCTAGLVVAGCRNGPSGTNGCPSGFAFTPGTPPGVYTLTVVASSGNLSHSVMIPLTVPAQ